MAHAGSVLRVSIDLGSQTTRILSTSAEKPELRTHATVFARGSAPNSFVVGPRSLRPRNGAEPIWPLERGVISSEEHCLTYLRILRKSVGPDADEVWAVLSAPSAGRDGEPQRLARLAGIAFDRALVVPGLTLTAIALRIGASKRSYGAVLLDLGAACLQAATIDAQHCDPAQIFHLAPGGTAFDLRLLRSIASLFPELAVDLLNVRQLKEAYGRLGGGPAVCLVQLVQGGSRRIVDIGPTIHQAVSPIAEVVAEAAGRLLGDPSGPTALTYGREVILTGGGARMPGIDAAVLSILKSNGYPTEKVFVPELPDELVVRGGWCVASLISHDHWEVLA